MLQAPVHACAQPRQEELQTYKLSEQVASCEVVSKLQNLQQYLDLGDGLDNTLQAKKLASVYVHCRSRVVSVDATLSYLRACAIKRTGCLPYHYVATGTNSRRKYCAVLKHIVPRYEG